LSIHDFDVIEENDKNSAQYKVMVRNN